MDVLAHHHTTFESTRIDTKLWGRWVESAVGVHLLNQAENEEYSVYYWRDHDDEVDFIVNRGGKITAIEVKSGRRGMNSGLPVFNGKFHPDKSIVVGTDGISLIDFFTSNIIDILA